MATTDIYSSLTSEVHACKVSTSACKVASAHPLDIVEDREIHEATVRMLSFADTESWDLIIPYTCTQASHLSPALWLRTFPKHLIHSRHLINFS